MANYTIPAGRNQGQAIEEADDRDLNYWITAKRKKLLDDPDNRYAAQDQAWIDAAVSLLDRRSNGESRPADDMPRQQQTRQEQAPRHAQQSQQIVKVGDGGLLKTAADAMRKVAELQGACHLVNSPAVGCGIPDGCAVAWSVTYLNVERDTYPIKGDANKVGVGKDALNMISMGMGVQWDPVLSRRLDDGSNPHYCRYIAVGKMRDSDGTWISIFDEKENDLRDGSQSAKDMTEKQLAQQRSNIWSLTVTKARNRAIRGRGVKCAYQRDELLKPFVSFKLVFTGESSDPEIRRMKARSMLESQSLLYGSPQPSVGLLPGSPPPPVTAYGETLEDPDGMEM